jgi:hypothetical protein
MIIVYSTKHTYINTMGATHLQSMYYLYEIDA